MGLGASNGETLIFTAVLYGQVGGGVNKSQGRATPLIFFLYWPTLGESFFFCLAASALPLGKAGQRRTKNSPQSLRVKSARHARPQKVEGLFRGGAILSG